MNELRRHYDEIYNDLTHAELQQGTGGFEELTAGPELFERDGDLWLDFYTHEGLATALERYGFFDDLRQQGFAKTRLETFAEQRDEHLLRVWPDDSANSDPLVELVVAREFLSGTGSLADALDEPVQVLTVKWLLMQHPKRSFSDTGRSPLPGQRHPGLGVGRQVMEMLRNACRRLKLRGLVNVPSYFHNAYFYGKEFQFFDPEIQGEFLALCRDLMTGVDNSIAAASWALKWGMVTDERSAEPRPYKWFHELMVNPVGDRFQKYFGRRDYRRTVQKVLSERRFRVRSEPLFERLEKRGVLPVDDEIYEPPKTAG